MSRLVEARGGFVGGLAEGREDGTGRSSFGMTAAVSEVGTGVGGASGTGASYSAISTSASLHLVGASLDESQMIGSPFAPLDASSIDESHTKVSLTSIASSESLTRMVSSILSAGLKIE